MTFVVNSFEVEQNKFRMRIRIIVNRPWFGVQPCFKPQDKFQVHAGNEAAMFSNEVILITKVILRFERLAFSNCSPIVSLS